MADLIKDHSDFDGEWYLKNYCNIESSNTEEGSLRKFLCQATSEIFSTGNIKGDNLLDIGTGPSIHSVISAAPHVQNIYLSDYNETNRNILKDWVEGKRDEGKAICQFILQQEANTQTVNDRFDEIRKKVRSVFVIDVNKWPMIPNSIPRPDVIVSSLCFDTACTSVEEYNILAKRLNQLLAPGGHLVVSGELGGTFYKVGDINYFALPLTELQLRGAYMNNGFDIKVWKESVPRILTKDNTEWSDYEKGFALYATKL